MEPVLGFLFIIGLFFWSLSQNKKTQSDIKKNLEEYGKGKVNDLKNEELRKHQLEAIKRFKANFQQKVKELQDFEESFTSSILESQSKYIEKFCELAEREVSALDEWGDENWDVLPKLKKDCIHRIATSYYNQISEISNLLGSANSLKKQTLAEQKKFIKKRVDSWFYEDMGESEYSSYKINEKIDLDFWQDFEVHLSGDLDFCEQVYTKEMGLLDPTTQLTGDTMSLVPKWSLLLYNQQLDKIFKEYHSKKKQSPTTKTTDINKMSGIEFENYVSTLLKNNGFNVSGTPTTGDQGADLIATKDGVTFIIQVKRHAKSVGNKAVQEVVAALNYYKGDKASVVTNSTFTTSARNLAKRNNVILVSRRELSNIEKLLV